MKGDDSGVQEWREMTPEELQMQKDYDWAVVNPELRKKYPDQIIVVYHGVALGAGEDPTQALAAARRHKEFPHDAEDCVAFVPIVADEDRTPEPSKVDHS